MNDQFSSITSSICVSVKQETAVAERCVARKCCLRLVCDLIPNVHGLMATLYAPLSLTCCRASFMQTDRQTRLGQFERISSEKWPEKLLYALQPWEENVKAAPGCQLETDRTVRMLKHTSTSWLPSVKAESDEITVRR